MSVSDIVAELGRLGVALVLLVVAFLVLGFLLGLGPLGWIILAGIALFIAVMNRPLDEQEQSHLDKVNCSNCGARMDGDAEVCDHCGEPLDAEAGSESGTGS